MAEVLEETVSSDVDVSKKSGESEVLVRNEVESGLAVLGFCICICYSR